MAEDGAALENVAAYVRMSTEHQRYSIENQLAAITAYARSHGMRIVAQYADPGRSGLTLRRRSGLSALLQDVLRGECEFTAVLVLDVSRWGRFQDIDESAHYEFLLRKAGVRVIYCAEPFENDGSPLTAILKSIKRAMAGEFSRDLGRKVTAGKLRLAESGYWLGGSPGYGLERLCIDEHGSPLRLLQKGDRKGRPTDRLVLRPGPPRYLKAIRQAFAMYADGQANQIEVMRWLNTRAPKRKDGRPWTRHALHNFFRNESYIGIIIYGKTSVPLAGKTIRFPPQEWVRRPAGFDPIVAPEVFDRVQKRLVARPTPEDELVRQLHQVLQEHGRLTRNLIAASPSALTPANYSYRFGSLAKAYERIGCAPTYDLSWVKKQRSLAPLKEATIEEIVNGFEERGHRVSTIRDRLLLVDDWYAIDVALALMRPTPTGPEWYVRNRRNAPLQAKVVLRMDGLDTSLIDYFVFPRDPLRSRKIRLRDENPKFDRYRADDLGQLFSLACPRLLRAANPNNLSR